MVVSSENRKVAQMTEKLTKNQANGDMSLGLSLPSISKLLAF